MTSGLTSAGRASYDHEIAEVARLSWRVAPRGSDARLRSAPATSIATVDPGA